MGSLIEKFNIEMIAPSCTPGASWWSAKIHIENDISDVMPYLNAVLKDTNYNYKSKILLWDSRDEGIRYAFRPNEIAVAPIEDRESANRLCNDIVGMICDIWTKRDTIEPDFTGKATSPNIIQIIRLLPATNCRECGFATCMAFAAGLIKNETKIDKCGSLLTNEYIEKRKQLEALFK